MADIPNNYEVELLDAIEKISTDDLKHLSHSQCIDRLMKIAERALNYDGTRVLLLIESIKCCERPCYKRDLLFDVLNQLMNSAEILIDRLLCDPFPEGRNKILWKELANGLATIPDLAANCNALTRAPMLDRELFHYHLLESMYKSFTVVSKQEHLLDEHKMYMLQLLGRISLSDESNMLIWATITSRTMHEATEEVQAFVAEMLQSTVSPNPSWATFELYVDRFYLPIFFNLTPSKDNHKKMCQLLGDSILLNEHLRYLICDKSIFKANYDLTRHRQSTLLFNISAYLASLVSRQSVGVGGEEKGDNLLSNKLTATSRNGGSLLIRTLLEIVRQWASATRVLLRTYEQSRYIAGALVVIFRYALESDGKTLVDCANEIQSMIASSLPIYLNRVSSDQRNLAMCLAELLLPKLHELMSAKSTGNAAVKIDDLSINWKIDSDDLIYLQQLFKQNIEVIFQDVPNDADTSSTVRRDIAGRCLASADAGAVRPAPSSSAYPSPGSKSAKAELRARSTGKLDTSDAATASRMKPPIVELIDGKQGATTTTIAASAITDDDLKPYAASCGDGDGDEEGAYGCTNSDDDEYELGTDCQNVPIYLRDCINGLVENNNRRYVRLCLIKAGELIDQLTEQDAETPDGRQMSLGPAPIVSDDQLRTTRNFSNTTSTGFEDRMVQRQLWQSQCQPHRPRECHINETISDVGVELARALLFLDNQFNIKGFKKYRRRALVSLCNSAPQLVGKYLIEEFNGTDRSMQQQLDILQILMESVERLSSDTPADRKRGGQVGEANAAAPSSSLSSPLSSAMGTNVGAMSKSVVKQRERQRQGINKFSAYAALYFYGIVWRLKFDFLDSKSLVITQPESVLSAFRKLKCQSIEEIGMGGAGGEDNQRPSVSVPLIGTKPLGIDLTKRHQEQRLGRQPPGRHLKSTTTTTTTTTTPATSDIDQDDDDGVDRFLERNSLSDESLLLSRILIGTSIIISSASQQPAVCKLSSDLMEILAAYRCHPDSGVQKSMIACLKAIRDHTPPVYYENFIEKRLVQMFAPWLAKLDQQ